MIRAEDATFDDRGLIPAVVQHSENGTVLMVAYMNREALEQTQRSGLVTFFSRSRNCLWTKGETSSHRLTLVDMRFDCDTDTILVLALPTGPVCHTGQETCFGEYLFERRFAFLSALEEVIEERARTGLEESYTARLLEAGPRAIGRKVAEEAVEVLIDSIDGTTDRVIDESADLLYHLMVLLRSRGVSLADVVSRLESRHKP